MYHVYISSNILVSTDVFRFTLYWTILFYIPPFLICGFYAFWNFAFPPWPKVMSNDVQMSVLEESVSPKPKSATYIRPVGTNEGRSRVTFAIIVFLIFISMSLAGAVIGSAILGFAAFGLYQSADFNMSTYGSICCNIDESQTLSRWIPFLLAVMYVLTGLLRQDHAHSPQSVKTDFLSLWPSIIEII